MQGVHGISRANSGINVDFGILSMAQVALKIEEICGS